jgi:GNAT superfamily N-acetyltransferase
VLLRIGSMWYSDHEVLEEKAIFIHPDYRNAKGGRARRLCEFSKQVADALGVPLIIGVLSNHRTKAKVRLYERQFGEPSGAFFLYNARTGAFRDAAE